MRIAHPSHALQHCTDNGVTDRLETYDSARSL
jgi:hypothetical protein